MLLRRPKLMLYFNTNGFDTLSCFILNEPIRSNFLNSIDRWRKPATDVNIWILVTDSTGALVGSEYRLVADEMPAGAHPIGIPIVAPHGNRTSTLVADKSYRPLRLGQYHVEITLRARQGHSTYRRDMEVIWNPPRFVKWLPGSSSSGSRVRRLFRKAVSLVRYRLHRDKR